MTRSVVKSRSVPHHRDALQKEVTSLKLTIRKMRVSQQEKDDLIRHLKGEVFAVSDQVMQDEDVISQAQSDFTDLCTKVQHLQE